MCIRDRWSVYPYFPSGNVVVSGIEQGLFVLRPNLPTVLSDKASDAIAPVTLDRRIPA